VNQRLSSPCLTRRCNSRTPHPPLEGTLLPRRRGCARGSSRPWYARRRPWRSLLNGRSLAGRGNMRLGLHFIVAAVGVVTSMAGEGRSDAAAPSKTLVFEGTVTSIRTIDNEWTPWLVTVMVTKVISGEFSGPTFQFAVHSPARAGLKEGGSYTIEAVWTQGGYTVDETQWRRRPKRLRTGPPSAEPANPALQRTIALPRCARAGARR